MNNYSKIAASLAVLAGVSSFAGAEQIWRVTGGTTTISLNEGLIKDSGLATKGIRETAAPHERMPKPIAFAITPKSDLQMVTTGGLFREFSGGNIRHSGGFTLDAKKAGFNLSDFTINPKGRFGWENLVVRSATQAPIFDLGAARIYFDRGSKTMTIYGLDMTLTPDMAIAAKRPDLAGRFVGGLTIVAHVEQIGGDAVDDGVKRDETPPEDSTNDVQLFALSSLTQSGREGGVFPNGTLGFGVSTTSCNTGTNNIDWFAAMDVRHPVIAFNVYRVTNDRFEQIGTSWLKHGWLATNSTSTGCAPCTSPGTGTKLGPGCSDTYGVFNNTDLDDLGPRNEMNPFTGIWTCVGSYFSGYQNDCVKRNTSSGWNTIDHKLQVREADLLDTTATYYYEAYYMTREDSNVYNNIGSRRFTPTYTTSWSFGSQTDFVRGPTIQQRYGDMNAVAQPQDEGDVIVAVKVTTLGGGNYRYNYAVYNHTSDRQVREFTVPVPDGLTVSNIYFRDPDTDANNDWTAVRSGGRIQWSTATYGNGGNPLAWNTTFNFGFTCNTPPRDSSAAIGLYKPGTNPCLTVATKAPVGATYPRSFTIVQGDPSQGGICDLFFEEGTSVDLFNDPATLAAIVDVTSTAPANAPLFRLNLRASVARNGLSMSVKFWNYATGAWVSMGGSVAPTTPTTTNYQAGTPADYMDATTREVKARISFNPINDESPAVDGWLHSLDMVRWQFVN